MADIHIKNKKAWHDYEILDTFVAGIKLTGTEIKSIRAGKASLVDAYCYFTAGELYVKGMHVTEYDLGTIFNHAPKRNRKLLLNRRELKKIIGKTREKGLTIVPVELFINDKGFCKVTISIAKGKKNYDKRETLKTKDNNRQMERREF